MDPHWRATGPLRGLQILCGGLWILSREPQILCGGYRPSPGGGCAPAEGSYGRSARATDPLREVMDPHRGTTDPLQGLRALCGDYRPSLGGYRPSVGAMGLPWGPVDSLHGLRMLCRGYKGPDPPAIWSSWIVHMDTEGWKRNLWASTVGSSRPSTWSQNKELQSLCCGYRGTGRATWRAAVPRGHGCGHLGCGAPEGSRLSAVDTEGWGPRQGRGVVLVWRS